MKFLFLLYHYPPLPGISPKRNFLISSALSTHAESALILTSVFSPTDRSTGNVQVRHVQAYDLRVLLQRRGKDAVVEHKKNNPWHQRMLKLMNTFPFSVLINEGGPAYLLNMVRLGNKAIRERQITHVYTAFRPFTDHIAGYILKKQNPHIYWIADFRDLPFDPFFNKVYFKKFHVSLFKKILGHANLVTTISDGLADHLKNFNKNVLVVRNGIVNMPDHIEPDVCPFFSIAYTGSMYLDQKNARPLFIALADLIKGKIISKADIRIVYAGKDDAYWNNMASEYHMEDILELKGNLTSSAAMDLQKKACINLLLSISSGELTGVLTGKMIEYFEAGHPILAIIKNQIDPELESILQELQIGKSFSDHAHDLSDIKDFILHEYNHWKKTGTNRIAVNPQILKERFSIESTTAELVHRMQEGGPLNPLKGTFDLC